MDNQRGILAILIGSTAFVAHDATVKLVSSELPSSEIVVLRGLVATAMMVIGVFVLRANRPLSILFQPLMLFRVLAAAGATVFIILALRHLPLATATTVLQATPLVVTAGAALLYGDAVGWRRWMAVFAGFLGVVLIVKPGVDFGGAAYLILLGLLCTTTRDLSTRGLPKDIPSIFVATASTAAAMLSGLAILPFDPAWTAPTPWAWAVLTVCAACLFIATTFMTIGLRTGEIAVVAPFRYAPVPVSLLLGYWLWGDVPDMSAWFGIMFVLGAGLYTLHRERVSWKARQTRTSPACRSAGT